ncbi:MAG: protein-export chaperone SecB [Proteobacteria bacterium]|nr:protein-export chaperone SecB [Pseudomonadota bacterium]
MADEPSPRETPKVDAATAKDDGGRHISIVAQYVKDLSFENPRAPASVLEQGTEPHGDLSVQVRSRKLGGDEYEVVLEFQIEAKKEGEIAFLMELQYAGVFRLAGFSAKELAAVQMIECPRLIYPFARRIIADTVRQLTQLLDGMDRPYELIVVDDGSTGEVVSPKNGELSGGDVGNRGATLGVSPAARRAPGCALAWGPRRTRNPQKTPRTADEDRPCIDRPAPGRLGHQAGRVHPARPGGAGTAIRRGAIDQPCL